MWWNFNQQQMGPHSSALLSINVNKYTFKIRLSKKS